MAHILPQVGELWLDQNGHHNLILREKEGEDECVYTLLTLDTGETRDGEHDNSWNTP